MKATTIVLALLFLLPGSHPASAQDAPDGAWTGVTVLLADGWRYRDVTVYLDPYGAGLWVQRPDGAERLVPSDKVARIIGPDGDDVTAVVLAGGRNPQAAPPATVITPPPATSGTMTGSVSPTGTEPRDEAWDGSYVPAVQASEPPTTVRPFKLAFSLEGGYGFPMGGEFDHDQPSWTAGARLRIGTTNKSYLGIGYRHQDLETVAEYSDHVTAQMEIYEGTFGWMSGARGHSPRSYFELGAAFMEWTVSFDYDGFSSIHSDSRGAFLLRTGVLVPLGEGFGLDMGVSWTYSGLIFKEESEPAGSLVAVHLGLTWMN